MSPAPLPAWLVRLQRYPLTWIALVAALIAIVLSILSPFFLTVGNITNLMKQVSIVAILAAGQSIVIISGGIDLSVGSVLALSAVTTGWLVIHGVSPEIATCGGVLVGTLAGFVNGVVITRGRIPPFIATLGMLGIARGLALVITGGVSYQVLKPFFLYYRQRHPPRPAGTDLLRARHLRGLPLHPVAVAVRPPCLRHRRR